MKDSCIFHWQILRMKRQVNPGTRRRIRRRTWALERLWAPWSRIYLRIKDWKPFGDWAEKASALEKELLILVDADTRAFEV
jgi:hypothetical protein